MAAPLPSVFWYRSLPTTRRPALTGTHRTDNLVIGGGIAGLSCAQRLIELGQQVTLIEASFIGAGATGKSSGFITPDSELGVTQLRRRFGDATARTLWQSAKDACDLIKQNVIDSGQDCGMIEADSFYCSRGRSGPRSLRDEHDAQTALGFDAHWHEHDITEWLGTSRYTAALRTSGTFGIQGTQYANALATLLESRGLTLLEHTPATDIAEGLVATLNGTIEAQRIFVCTDRYAPRLGIQTRSVYRARTYLAITRPLPRDLLHQLFPKGPLLVWDTDLVYQYFRPTPDHRLLVGGSLLTHSTRAGTPDPAAGLRHLTQYIESTFPQLAPARFEAYWPGLIGVSKDILPIAGPVADTRTIHCALCAAGLPWSTLAARTAVDSALERPSPIAPYFNPARAFGPADSLQPLLGKPNTWGLAYYYAREYQRGGLRRARTERNLTAAALTLAAAAALYATARALRNRATEMSSSRWAPTPRHRQPAKPLARPHHAR